MLLNKPLKSKIKAENKQILKIVRSSYFKSHGICGLDKLLCDVREKFPHCSRQRLYRIQSGNKLYSIGKRKFKATTYSDHKLPVAENLLNQDFKVESSNSVWVTDISYIGIHEGWLYLATVKDCVRRNKITCSMLNSEKNLRF